MEICPPDPHLLIISQYPAENSAETAGPKGMSVAQRNLRRGKKSFGVPYSTKALGKYLGKQTTPANPLWLCEILWNQDTFCPRSENLVFCTCCSAEGWLASFILRFPGDENPQHSVQGIESTQKETMCSLSFSPFEWLCGRQPNKILESFWEYDQRVCLFFRLW